jgi:cytochrome c oxidase subunit 1
LFGMPRRVATYDPVYGETNLFISISAFVLGASFIIFAYNALKSAKSGEVAGPNPWGARTLEWMIPSPPPYYNFDRIPIVLHGPYAYGEPLPYRDVAPEYLNATPLH